MKNKLFTLLTICVIWTDVSAQDALFISTNKVKFVVGEQVMFTVNRFGQGSEDQKIKPIFTDLVAPNGQIIQTKSVIISSDADYFFSLSDTLKTGVYRLISNSAGASQAVKNIHVYALELEEQTSSEVSTIQARLEGDIFASNQNNRIVVRALDANGAGVQSKGTLVNSVDSLIQYLDTDANGIVAVALNPTDSLYKIRFGKSTIELKPEQSDFTCKFQNTGQSLTILLERLNRDSEIVEIVVNDEPLMKSIFQKDKDSLTIVVPGQSLSHGIHKIGISFGARRPRNYNYFHRPVDKQLQLNTMVASNNEQVEYVIDDSSDEIDHVDVSVIDINNAHRTDFYQEYYFDQAGLDLQVVNGRDFGAYLTFFGDDIRKIENTDRLDAEQYHGALSYRENFPFDEVSVLNLSTMKAFDIRCESITGIQDFERVAGSQSQIFPYHFTTYLQPIDRAIFEESVNYQYQALSATLHLTDEETAYVKEYDTQRNIILSYQDLKKQEVSLPEPDFVYDMADYDVPNTMIDLINYVVKYVSVGKSKDKEPELSMYRYMSSYKYRGSPLIFLNNLPVYDKRTILNLNPKDLSRVEVRNSYRANDHLGNFSLNGSVSFYLKDGVDNPLEEAYKDLPILERCKNFNTKLVDSEFAPDFRHQLYWQTDLIKRSGAFWVDLKTSDLSTTYKILVTAFMKNGDVIHDESLLVVQ